MLARGFSFCRNWLRGPGAAGALAMLVSPLPLQSAGADYLPSIKIGTAPLVAPATADTYYNTHAPDPLHPDQSTDGLGAITDTPTPTPVELVELARSLKNDPDLIYQYVRNNIQTVWMYGLQKGALGASIDKSGTPFDQAELMVDLNDAIDKLAATEPRLARVVECRFFGGLSEEETAEVLEVNARTVQRDWAKARMLLRRALSP